MPGFSRDDIPTGIDRMVAVQRVTQALVRMGVSFADCAAVIEFDPDEATASWSHDPVTGAERIRVGPSVAALPVESVEMVIRHEVLHRSLYNAFAEDFPDRLLANVALDTCINRLLTEAWPQAMTALSTALYPPESVGSVVALPNCAADPARVPDAWRDLWRHVWDRGPDGARRAINPASLYFRIVRIASATGEAGRCAGCAGETDPRARPAPCRGCRPRPMPDGMPDGPAGRVAASVAEGIRSRLPAGSAAGSALEDYSVLPASIGTGKVEDFLRRIRIRRVADATARKVTERLGSETRVQPWPGYPTRLGLAYLACGVSDALRLYWNRTPSVACARVAIGMYVDVSGSMTSMFPVVAAFVGALKEYPLRVRVFDTEVREADPADLAAGRVKGGGGTSFDAPIRDLVADRDLAAGVLFTDGEAAVGSESAAALKKSGKPLHVVYLVGKGRGFASPLDALASSSVVVAVGE